MERRKARFPTKASVGIILCRKNPYNNKTEALIVQRRYTYAYSEFIHGHYGRSKNEIARVVPLLLNEMTDEEVNLVKSLNFYNMWVHIWSDYKNPELFRKKQALFYNIFISKDQGYELLKYANIAKPYGMLTWEFPKGRHNSLREPDISCAIRELYEETGVYKEEYKFIPYPKKIIIKIDRGVKYVYTFYVAIILDDFKDLLIPGILGEIKQIKWDSFEQIRNGIDQYCENIIKPIFSFIESYNNGITYDRILQYNSYQDKQNIVKKTKYISMMQRQMSFTNSKSLYTPPLLTLQA